MPQIIFSLVAPFELADKLGASLTDACQRLADRGIIEQPQVQVRHDITGENATLREELVTSYFSADDDDEPRIICGIPEEDCGLADIVIDIAGATRPVSEIASVLSQIFVVNRNDAWDPMAGQQEEALARSSRLPWTASVNAR